MIALTESTSVCPKCGGRVIYRQSAWHVKAKRTIRPIKARTLAIHLDGPCGQLQLGLN